MKTTIKIIHNERNMPQGRLADAELHLSGGELDGLKLIGFGVGCRQGEMQKIQNSDIDWRSHEIKIAKAHTKGSVARRIPFDPDGRLAAILRKRHFIGGPKGVRLLVTGEDRSSETVIVCGAK